MVDTLLCKLKPKHLLQVCFHHLKVFNVLLSQESGSACYLLVYCNSSSILRVVLLFSRICIS